MTGEVPDSLNSKDFRSANSCALGPLLLEMLIALKKLKILAIVYFSTDDKKTLLLDETTIEFSSSLDC